MIIKLGDWVEVTHPNTGDMYSGEAKHYASRPGSMFKITGCDWGFCWDRTNFQDENSVRLLE